MGGTAVPAAHPGPSRLYSWLAFNRHFVATRQFESVRRGKIPASRRAVIVTCMDTRLTRLLPQALNLRDGEAKLIKNAGAIITHPFGGIMRSVIVALYELRADEVFIIGHTDCGMSRIAPSATLTKMLDSGVPAATLDTLESAGINVRRWLHGFDSVDESVRNSVAVIRNHPLVPPSVAVHGLLIDPETGQLDCLIDGNLALEELRDKFPRRFSRSGSITSMMAASHAPGTAAASASAPLHFASPHSVEGPSASAPSDPSHIATVFAAAAAAAAGGASATASPHSHPLSEVHEDHVMEEGGRSSDGDDDGRWMTLDEFRCSIASEASTASRTSTPVPGPAAAAAGSAAGGDSISAMHMLLHGHPSPPLRGMLGAVPAASTDLTAASAGDGDGGDGSGDGGATLVLAEGEGVLTATAEPRRAAAAVPTAASASGARSFLAGAADRSDAATGLSGPAVSVAGPGAAAPTAAGAGGPQRQPLAREGSLVGDGSYFNLFMAS